MISFAGLLAKV